MDSAEPVQPNIQLTPIPNSTAPATAMELVEFVKNLVVDHFARTGASSNGAGIAEAIRRRYPNLSYPQIGLERLSDAVRLGEQQGLLLRRRDVMHLEVSPGPAAPLSAQNLARPASLETQSAYLRPDLWRALIFINRYRISFFDRITGVIREFLTTHDVEAIKACEADSRYVLIPHVSSEKQQQWMHAFVEAKQFGDAIGAPIDEEMWWQKFPEWLRQKGATLEGDWKTFRSKLVLNMAKEWAEENRIPTDAIFAKASFRKTPFDRGRPNISESVSNAETLIRRAIVDAISEMPIERLEEIAIPIRYILRHFRAL